MNNRYKRESNDTTSLHRRDDGDEVDEVHDPRDRRDAPDKRRTDSREGGGLLWSFVTRDANQSTSERHRYTFVDRRHFGSNTGESTTVLEGAMAWNTVSQRARTQE